MRITGVNWAVEVTRSQTWPGVWGRKYGYGWGKGTILLIHSRGKGRIPLIHSREKGRIVLTHNRGKGRIPLIHSRGKDRIPLIHSREKGRIVLIHNRGKGRIPLIHSRGKGRIVLIHNRENGGKGQKSSYLQIRKKGKSFDLAIKTGSYEKLLWSTVKKNGKNPPIDSREEERFNPVEKRVIYTSSNPQSKRRGPPSGAKQTSARSEEDLRREQSRPPPGAKRTSVKCKGDLGRLWRGPRPSAGIDRCTCFLFLIKALVLVYIWWQQIDRYGNITTSQVLHPSKVPT